MLKKIRQNEIGRTMTEVIAVLAIAGLLSMIAGASFRYLHNKRLANDLINEVKMRAMVYSPDLMNKTPIEEKILLDTEQFKTTLPYSFPAAALKYQFYIQSLPVSKGVCKIALQMGFKLPFQIDTANKQDVNGDPSACEDANTLTFYFKANLTECVDEEDEDCEAIEVCTEDEQYCGLKCYNPETHECLYPNEEICQIAPYEGLDVPPSCQTGEDYYECCKQGEICRLDPENAPYYHCAKCAEDETLMNDDLGSFCCPNDKICNGVCCMNSEFICQQGIWCIAPNQWCENMACINTGERCTSVGCCLNQKACRDDTICCEDGEVCVMNKGCCPEERASERECCAETEHPHKTLCCDTETTKGMTSINLEVCCPLDRICKDIKGREVCSIYDDAATDPSKCVAMECDEGQQLCNLTCYDPNVYECINNTLLCQTKGDNPTQTNCNGTCCNDASATCLNGTTCCLNTQINGEGEDAICCPSGQVLFENGCCKRERKCNIDGEDVCCPDGNCCEITSGTFQCCGAGTKCDDDPNNPGQKACIAPTACESNEDCLETQFCKSANNVAYDAEVKNGVCTDLYSNTNTTTLQLDDKSSVWKWSTSKINRWSAENFCAAHGMSMDIENLMCDGDITSGQPTAASGSYNAPCTGTVMTGVFKPSNFDVHVRKSGDTIYVIRMPPYGSTSAKVWYGTPTGYALCKPNDFTEAWTCPSTRENYSAQFNTCAARACYADEYGHIDQDNKCSDTEYCHYTSNYTTGECADQISYAGVCRPINDIAANVSFSIAADGKSSNHVWKRSTISMPWLSAQEFCQKLGRQVATREQICGRDVGTGSYPCSESATYSALVALQGSGLPNNPYVWLEEADTCNAYRGHPLNTKFSITSKVSTSGSPIALCSETFYHDPCGNKAMYNKETQMCERLCDSNADCTPLTEYCSLNTFVTNDSCVYEMGLCRSLETDRKDYLIAYEDDGEIVTEEWVTSSRTMNWDTAKNFCAALRKPMLTQENLFTHGSEVGQRCNTSPRCLTLKSSINPAYAWWFGTEPVSTNMCNAYQEDSSNLGKGNLPTAAARKDSYLPLCGPYNVQTKACDEEHPCSAPCASHEDCDEALGFGYFCKFDSETAGSNCSPTGRCVFRVYNSARLSVNDVSLGSWVGAKDKMDWWSAMDFCDSLEMELPNKSSLFNYSGTANATGDLSGPTLNQVLAAFPFRDGENSIWLSDQRDCYGYRGTYHAWVASDHKKSSNLNVICQEKGYAEPNVCPQGGVYNATSGMCGVECSTHDDCESLGDNYSCKFNMQTAADCAPTGTCAVIPYGEQKLSIDGVSIGKWVKASMQLDWWSAMDFCDNLGMELPSKLSLYNYAGTANVSLGLNTKTAQATVSAFGYTDGINSIWLSDQRACYGYRATYKGYVASDHAKTSNRYVICQPKGYQDSGLTSCPIGSQEQNTCDCLDGSCANNPCTQVEYLQSNGSQYIDTGWATNWNKNISITGHVAIPAAGHRLCIIGGHPNKPELNIEVTTAQKLRLFENGGNVNLYSSASLPINTKIAFDFSYDVTSGASDLHAAGGGFNETISVTRGQSGTCSATSRLFLDNRGSTFSALRIYDIKIYNDKLVRDFVPVKNACGVPAMYDRVTEQLFYNPPYTSDFIIP